jgi:hypothetical protein
MGGRALVRSADLFVLSVDLLDPGGGCAFRKELLALRSLRPSRMSSENEPGPGDQLVAAA